ncbi:patatin-like protein [Niveispirillum irakense]|uniref:patatin-like protein n=1 Tax=Niveispirillum irakense TaxID=34011 RepID=UPI000415BF87|nr:patatin-like protein [Niveispirillum irakense]
MKEKELRIALVCYGGVSLAVYMHGVTKELWKLVRASHALHAPPHGPAPVLEDTEQVYHALLSDLLPDLSLRVLIDVAAGASAGGINAVLLARALAHDLDLEPLTRLWLENADVTRLLTPGHRAGKYSKWFMRPLLWLWFRRYTDLAPDQETRDKLSLFTRSRWFSPPFDGDRLMGFLLDAAYAMGDSNTRPEASLMPRGLPLSLHVTATDFHGYTTRIPAHDPPEVTEREHRHRFSFHYRRRGEGVVESDFRDGDVPGLAFAARASASFPGAFPPAQLRQIDRLLNERGQSWDGRAHFFERNFAEYRRHGADPEQASFIDGSVLNNKPFAAAIAAIAGRPAYREVDRRVLYIDPKPAPHNRPGTREAPGFFRTIRGALSDIPRNEPVRDELLTLAARNDRIRRLRGMLEAARPRVTDQVAQVVGGDLPPAPSIEQIRHWRDAASVRAAAQAGFAYEGYLRLKIENTLEGLARLLAPCLGRSDQVAQATMLEALQGWARQRGVLPDRIDLPPGGEGETGPAAPAWVQFLRDFDIAFRDRRLRFLIRELNAIYPLAGQGEHADTKPADLDEMKLGLYNALERLPRVADGLDMFNAGQRSALNRLLRGNGGNAPPEPAALDQALPQIAAAWGLEAQSAEVDEIFALVGLNYLGPAARRHIFESYLGFAFWDVLTFSTSGWGELDEFYAIKVDRIGPPDARLLRRAGAPVELRSARMNAFGGFFSRNDRVQDYVLGRLHAAERCIDLLVDAGGLTLSEARINAHKLRAFHAILQAEEARFGCDHPAMRQIRQWVEGCG